MSSYLINLHKSLFLLRNAILLLGHNRKEGFIARITQINRIFKSLDRWIWFFKKIKVSCLTLAKESGY